jgi:LAO/AO transport system kinase
MSLRRTLQVSDYVRGVLAADRSVLARAITLVESTNPEHAAAAQDVLQQLLPYTGGARRLGISGTPGAGKSTLIDVLGTMLVDAGRKTAVLAVDPSSATSRGSILGDRTRMGTLASRASAFIRPSPTAGSLGGVARKTREALLLCEAAGFEVIVVETIGIGQSEGAVAGMVDFFVLLAVTGGGDELQGIKRGVLELIDMLVVTKADGDNRVAAQRTRREYDRALRVLRSERPVQVLCASALAGHGVAEIWATIERDWDAARAAGTLEKKRQAQQLAWFSSLLEEALLERLRANPAVVARMARLTDEVSSGRATPAAAVGTLLAALVMETTPQKS